MNRRAFLLASTGCAVAVSAPQSIRKPLNGVWVSQELLKEMPAEFFNRLQLLEVDPLRMLFLVRVKDFSPSLLRWSVNEDPDKW